MAKKTGISVLPNRLGMGSDVVNPTTEEQLPVPQETKSVTLPRPGTGVATLSFKGSDGWDNMAQAPMPKPSIINKGRVQNFNADMNHGQFERYYNHPKFKTLGFNPFRDNETHYNELTSGWSDFRRTFAQWGSLGGTGFMDAMSFGPSSDRDAARKFEKAMAIGQSSRGGVAGFSTNLFLNSGYTFGIIAEMLAEEAVLFAIGAFTGGSTGSLMAARGAAKVKLLDKAFDVVKAGENAVGVINKLDNLKDISNMRKFWNGAVKTGEWAGRRIAPESLQYIKHFDEIKNLKPLAKVSTGLGSLYKDIRNVRLAYSESSLEAGMVENELLEEFYQEKWNENGGSPLTDKQINEVRKRAKLAANKTFMWNLPTILLSNQIVFDNMFHSFSPVRKILGKPFMKNIAGETVVEFGKHVSPMSIVESNFKGTLKAFTKPRTYARFAAGYFRGNIAEGLQETAQEIISGAAKDFYRQDPKDPMVQSFYSMMADNTAKQWSSQGFETFASGFLMGGPVSAVTTSFAKAADTYKKFRDPEYAKKVIDAREQLIDVVDEWNTAYDDPMNFFNPLLENAVDQKNAAKNMADAQTNGDKKGFYDNQHMASSKHAITMIQNGMMDGLIERMEDYSTMNAEERKEAFPNLKGKPEEYEGKMEKMLSQAKALKDDYAMITSNFPAPPHPSSYKDPTEYAIAANKYRAHESMIKQLLFMRSSVANGVSRRSSILDNAITELKGAKVSGTDFISLFDISKTEDLLTSKITLIKNYGDIINSLEGEEKNKAEKYLETQLGTIKAVKDFSDAREQWVSIPDAKQFENDKTTAYNNFYDAYKNIVSTLSEGETPFDDTLVESFNSLIDFTKLKKEDALVTETINYLLDPDNFEIQLERVQEAFKIRQENRIPFFKEMLEKYMDDLGRNEVLQNLFNEGVFLSPEDTNKLLNDGVFPEHLYNTTSPYDEVVKSKDPRTWDNAVKVITDWMHNVKGKPIPESKGSSSYVTKSREKLPGDHRTYEDLAKQYGFDPTKTETKVPLKLVLQKLINSEYATRPEKLLAARYLTLAQDEEFVNFKNDMDHPGTYSSDPNIQTLIDPRYNASDYKNGGEPIEVVLLHEETHRRTVQGLKTDSKFEGKMQGLFDTVLESQGLLEFKKQNEGKLPYGLSNLAEFVSEVMSNPTFQALLSEIPVDVPNQAAASNAWTTFVEAVLEFLESTFGKEKTSGTVLNAAAEIISMHIDTTFGGKIENYESGDKITTKTPLAIMPDALVAELLQVFDASNETTQLLPNRNALSDGEVLASDEFEKWLAASPPSAVAVIAKYNVKPEVKPTATTKTEGIVVVDNVTDDIATFTDWIDPNVKNGGDVKGVRRHVNKMTKLGQKLDTENPNWTYGNLKAIVDGKQVVEITAGKDTFLMVNDAGEWYPMFKWAGNGSFIKSKSQAQFFKSIAKELKVDEAEMFGEEVKPVIKVATALSKAMTKKLIKLGFTEEMISNLSEEDKKLAKTFRNKKDAAEMITKYTVEEIKPKVSGLRYKGVNPTVDVMAIRTVDGTKQVLLIKRADTAVEGGKWALPGGFHDTKAKAGSKWTKGKETSEEAARREISEETGLDLGDATLNELGVYDDKARDPRNSDESWISTTLYSVELSEEQGKEVAGKDDAQDAKWFNEEELNAMTPEEFAFDHAEHLKEAGLKTDKPIGEKKDNLEIPENIRPLVEKRAKLQEELDRLRELLNPKSRTNYYSYPKLTFAEGLNNVLDALDKIGEYRSFSIAELELMLKDIGANEFLLNEFAKIKELLQESGVLFETSLGEEVSSTSYAEFIASENKIVLNLGLLLADPKIETAGDIAQIIVHEAIHGATVYKTAAYDFKDVGETAPLSTLDRAAIKDLYSVLRELQERDEFENEYGMTNLNEMLAELSNKKFVDKLKATKIAEGTLWTKLVDAIVRLISGVDKTQTAYERIYNSYEILLGSNATAQQQAFKEKLNQYDWYLAGKAINKETAIADREIEYNLLKEQESAPSFYEEIIKQEERLARLTDRDLYDKYKSETGPLNINQIQDRILELESQIRILDDEIKAIQQGAEVGRYITAGQGKILADLEYTRKDIQIMTPLEAREIIKSGKRKGEVEREIEKGIEEAARKRALEKKEIRDDFETMLAEAVTFEDMAEVIKEAHRILSNVKLSTVSEYEAAELDGLIQIRKQELAEHIDFDMLDRGSVVYRFDNANARFVVTSRTKNTVKMRKLGDTLGPVFTVYRKNASEQIKYMSNDFLEEAALVERETTAEESKLIKEDMESAKKFTDAEKIAEDIDAAEGKSNEQLDDEFLDDIDDDCK